MLNCRFWSWSQLWSQFALVRTGPSEYEGARDLRRYTAADVYGAI